MLLIGIQIVFLKIKKNNISIEEKAEESAGYNTSFPGVPTAAEMDSRYDGFKAGAEQMFEKDLEWFPMMTYIDYND